MYKSEFIALSSKNTDIGQWLEEMRESVLPIVLDKVWSFMQYHGFTLSILCTLLVIALIIKFAIKHMPSKGRITDVYDEAGNRREVEKKKKKKSKDAEDINMDLNRFW